MAASNYSAEQIEVLSGLDPVRKRPGMYTDTSRPNHLAQEVIDNSVDEALAGYAKRIDVIVFADGSCQVSDDGRGMPVDIHPEHKVSGVELILTRLHSGAKFSNNAYGFSGGLHGVGVSVVNALSKKLEVRVSRGGSEYAIGFANGDLASKLKEIGSVPKNRSGTTVHFWPDEKYFDSAKISMPRLKQVLRAKAVLCPNLRVSLDDQINGEQVTHARSSPVTPVRFKSISPEGACRNTGALRPGPLRSSGSKPSLANESPERKSGSNTGKGNGSRWLSGRRSATA